MSRMWVVGLLALVLLSVPDEVRAGEHPHERNGWTFGFNLGGGSAGFKIDGDSTDRQGGGAGNLRVGYCPSPMAAIGLEGSFWSAEVDNVTWTFSLSTIAVTFYPGEQGFFIRGGAGVGTVSAETKVGSTTITAEDSGFGLTVAGGHEWRLTRSFALGPQVEYTWLDVGNGVTADYLNVTAALNWYW